jgi:hypothetical protein
MAQPPTIAYGVGLRRTRNTVDLKLANEDGEIGGVKVPARGPGQGLDLDTQGFLTAPPATHEHLGGILEPPKDGKAYARSTDTTTGIADWTEVAGSKTAGNTVAEIGVVYVPARSLSTGLDIDKDGCLRAPPATHEHLGGIIEPTKDGKLYVRSTDATTGIGNWIETKAVKPAGNTPDKIGVVFVPDDRGLDLDAANGSLTLLPASDNRLGGLFDVPALPNDRTYVRKYAEWVEAPASKTAGNTVAEIGVVYVPARSLTTGLDIDADGCLRAPPATHEHLGGIIEPPKDGKSYARSTDITTGIADWMEVEAAPVRIAGTTPAEAGKVYVVPGGSIAINPEGGLSVVPTTDSQFGTIVDAPFAIDKPHARKQGKWVEIDEAAKVRIAGTTPTTAGIVYVVPGLGIGINAEGGINAHPATDTQMGIMQDAPFAIDKPHARKQGKWVEIADSKPLYFEASVPWNLTGTEAAGDPGVIINIPASALPTTAVNYTVQSFGVGTIYMHNKGMGAQPITGNGCSFYVGIETAPGTFVEIASMGFSVNSFPDATERLWRGSAQVNAASQIFRYDPAVPGGINLRARFNSGTAVGNPLSIFLGLQGMILPE